MEDNRVSFNNDSFSSSNPILNQSQSEFTPPSIFHIKDNNPHFQLSSLYKDFEQDELALKEFIEVVITNLNRLSVEILKAFRQNDLIVYEQVHYKILTTLKMIQASTLQDLLAQGRDLMKRKEIAPEGTILMNLKKEFAAVLGYLRALK